MRTKEEENKALVMQALDEAFNKRDTAAYDRYWSPDYIQHSAVIPPGREGLRVAMSTLPKEFKYESGLVVAEDDYVMVHGRYSGIGTPKPWIIVDIFRIENGLLAEHWDVIQDEASLKDSKSGLPMFGENFFSEL
ncbi:nuclear transport factor 2 family protein [Chitinophaga sp. CF418]|uniref:nuclear transport factor 2 family protein n=1 Tax=Chitinophaga sp. CF418 TaxID=1855287 RepID=UPI00091391F6|nr:nuclear transport factor 2 family protein [Chitinophaga sp. CF418]SHN34157.1 Predicted SnoaL-like aldol condensation-catalyzing enzyme [Chitinophaga sp. CF418]